MKKSVYILLFVGCLTSCGIFSHTTELSCPANTQGSDNTSSPHSGCPPAAFGAEKILAYQNRQEAAKHATAKGDPVTGKKTSQAKGIRTGELDKPVRLSRSERREARRERRRKRAEDRALERQLRRDAKLAKTEQAGY